MTKKIKSNNSGITLIALVVTIIVLIILVGIVVATLMGDNGIIKRAGDAKEAQRGATVQDEVTLAIAENEMIDQLNSVNGGQENKKTKTDIVNELAIKGYLTSDDEIELETEDEITIGGITIDFSALENASGNSTLAFGLQVDGSFIGLKSMGKIPAEHNPSGIDNSQKANPIADGTGYRFEAGHFVYAENYSYYDYDAEGYIQSNVYLCWDDEDGTINDADTRMHTFGEWDVFSISGTWLGIEGLRRFLNESKIFIKQNYKKINY